MYYENGEKKTNIAKTFFYDTLHLTTWSEID